LKWVTTTFQRWRCWVPLRVLGYRWQRSVLEKTFA
jgi:hypothetical protein